MAVTKLENEIEHILESWRQTWSADLDLPFAAELVFLPRHDDQTHSVRQLRSYLSPKESEHFKGLQARSNEGRAQEWLLGRLSGKLAVRRLIMAEGGVPPGWSTTSILPDALGKPSVIIETADDADLAISLSHTRTGVLAMAARDPDAVGIDLESLDRAPANCQGFARHVLNEAEMAQMDFAPGCAERLLRYWVAKEAAAKAVGTGFQGQPKQFALARLPVEGINEVIHDGLAILVHIKRRAGFLLAVAYRTGDTA